MTDETKVSAGSPCKPGYKTTEFWLSTVAALLGILFMSGILPADSPLERIAGTLAAALTAAGYSVARSKAKAPVLLLALCGVMALASGCARFTTTQRDITYGTNGELARLITTRATSTTFFEAKSDLAKFRASQTDKSQTATVGTLGQETTSTNLAPVVEAVATGVAKGVAEAVKGGL